MKYTNQLNFQLVRHLDRLILSDNIFDKISKVLRDDKILNAMPVFESVLCDEITKDLK